MGRDRHLAADRRHDGYRPVRRRPHRRQAAGQVPALDRRYRRHRGSAQALRRGCPISPPAARSGSSPARCSTPCGPPSRCPASSAPSSRPWLLDGGLVNPVPVSLCRALGADVVIAVNLNGDVFGRWKKDAPPPRPTGGASLRDSLARMLAQLPAALGDQLKQIAPRLMAQRGAPGYFDVLAGAIDIGVITSPAPALPANRPMSRWCRTCAALA